MSRLASLPVRVRRAPDRGGGRLVQPAGPRPARARADGAVGLPRRRLRLSADLRADRGGGDRAVALAPTSRDLPRRRRHRRRGRAARGDGARADDGGDAPLPPRLQRPPRRRRGLRRALRAGDVWGGAAVERPVDRHLRRRQPYRRRDDRQSDDRRVRLGVVRLGGGDLGRDRPPDALRQVPAQGRRAPRPDSSRRRLVRQPAGTGSSAPGGAAATGAASSSALGVPHAGQEDDQAIAAAIRPPATSVVRTPIEAAAIPATRMPIGERHIENSQSTEEARPSISGGTSSCIIVFQIIPPYWRRPKATAPRAATTSTSGARPIDAIADGGGRPAAPHDAHAPPG